MIQRSNSYKVTALVTWPGLKRAKVLWRIARLDHAATFESSRVVLEVFMDRAQGNNTSWEITRRSLQNGRYYIEVTASIENLPRCIAYSYGFLQITESPLEAVVVAKPSGKQLFQDLYKFLILNASDSYDPDLSPGEENGLNFMWLCARKDEYLPNNTRLLPVVTPVGKKGTANTNGTGCYGSGPGKLNVTGSTANISLQGMRADTTYVIKLILSKDKRRKELSYEFTLRKMEHFYLTIK